MRASRWQSRRCRWRFWPVVVVSTLLATCGWTRSAAAGSVWELTPYRVQLIVALPRTAELGPRVEADLKNDLVGRVDAVVGAAWDVTPAEADPRLRHRLSAAIETITIGLLPEESTKSDKVILLGVDGGPAGSQVVAREFDVRTQIFGTTVRLPLWQPAKLRDTAFEAVREAFAPLAQVVRTPEKEVRLRLRAAGLPPRDPDLVLAGTGDVFQPLIRYNDRQGKLRRVAVIPWTYLTIEGETAAGFECRVHSGLRSPLSERRRGRIEQLALAVNPPERPTRLSLQSRTEPEGAPLAGYTVHAKPPDSKTTVLLGYTDSRGSIEVPPADHPLRILLVKNGGQLLARLPIVPGLMPEVTASITNDDQRLEFEGFVIGLQERLIDLVTRREVLLTWGRARLKAKKLSEADELINQLQDLQSRAEFGRILATQRKRVLAADPLVQRKIDALFDDTQELLDKYLDQKPIDELARRLRQARRKADGTG